MFQDHISRGVAISEDILLQHRDGHLLPAEVSAALFEIEGRPFVQGIFRDITERRLAEAAILASEAKLRLILENVQEIIYDVSFDTGPLTSSTNYVSAQVESLIGYTPQEFYDNPWLFQSILHPDDEDETRTFMNRLIETGEGGLRQYRLRHKTTGEYHWMDDRVVPVKDDAGAVVGFQGVARDVTEQRLAEEALRKSETNFRSLYQQLQDGFVKVGMDGTILECNDAYCALTGYTREELGRFTYMDLTPENWHAMERRHLEDEILKLGASELYEKEYRRKDGSLVPVELRAQVTRDGDGTPLFMWAVVRDIIGAEGGRGRPDRERSRASVRSSISPPSPWPSSPWTEPSSTSTGGPSTPSGTSPRTSPPWTGGGSGLSR